MHDPKAQEKGLSRFLGMRSFHNWSGHPVLALNAFFSALLLVSVFLRPFYHPQDYPYFAGHPLRDFLYILLVFFLVGTAYRFLNPLSWSIWSILILSGVVRVFFIFAFPLLPFSDMKEVFMASVGIATAGFSGIQAGYFSIYPFQLPFSLLLGAWMRLFPDALFAAKLLNVVAALVGAWFAYGIYQKVAGKTNNALLLILAFFPASIGYSNHVYNDTIATTLFLAALWGVVCAGKGGGLRFILSGFALACGDLLRPIGFLFVVPLIVALVIRSQKKGALLFLVSYISVRWAVPSILSMVVQPTPHAAIPHWAYLYMAFNPEEFGFQDGSLRPDRSLFDVVHRLLELGPLGVLGIIAKKNFWMWMEGTYQAQRYAFGDSGLFAFSHSTPFVRLLLDGTRLREHLDTLMYAIHYVTIAGTVWFLNKGKLALEERVFVLILLCFILFYTCWEIKSRYLFAIHPILLILAFRGFDCILPSRTPSPVDSSMLNR